MRREKAMNTFLFFFLQAMLFVCFFPIYFSVDQIHVRTVTLPERMFSLMFVFLWIALCVYAAWKKRLPLVVGGVLYSIMAYIPGWILPHLTVAAGSVKPQGLAASLLETFFEKMYELVSAPLAGVSLLVSEKAYTNLSRWLLPVLLVSYAGMQIFRFYRNAYLAEQLHLEDTAYFSNPSLARELASAPGTPVFFASQLSADPAGKAPAGNLQNKPINLPANMPASGMQNGTDEDDQTRLHVPGL